MLKDEDVLVHCACLLYVVHQLHTLVYGQQFTNFNKSRQLNFAIYCIHELHLANACIACLFTIARPIVTQAVHDDFGCGYIIRICISK